MKKLFYIVLVVAILFLITMFVKNNATQAPISIPEAVVEEAVSVQPTEDGVIVTDEVVEVVAPIAEEAASVEDVEETNPDATADEGETIVKE